MLQIHSAATPIIIADNKQVGWSYENRDFTYQAIQSHDGRVDVYIIWGDDQPNDVTWFIDFEGAKRYLDILLQTSQR